MTNPRGATESSVTWSSTPFYVAGAMFAVAATFSAASVVADAERLALLVGEAFIATGWIAGLVGLLGLYAGLADRSRWLTRAGATFSVIGIVAFVVLAAASLVAFFTGATVERGVSVAGIPLIYLLPGIIPAPILAFASFSAASLRTGVHSRAVGVLLVIPSFIVVGNVATPPALPGRELITLGIECGLALTMIAIGYLLRTGSVSADGVESAPDTTVS